MFFEYFDKTEIGINNIFYYYFGNSKKKTN